ncbi:hypothetical protein KAW18_01910 [candidate division WOR-3 bacterium]|nr:hypothetical protein [candidate division WOR-3 bacterium]
MRKAPEGYKVFDGRLYQFNLRGTKREIDSEAKRLMKLGYSIRRTKTKSGWNLWKGFKYRERK